MKKLRKVLAIIVVMLWAVVFGLIGLINSNPDETEGLTTDIVLEAIEDYGLDESVHDVIYNFIPNPESIIKFSQEAAASYEVTTKDGITYLVSFFIAGENKGKIATIQTNEADYELRTRLYNFGD